MKNMFYGSTAILVIVVLIGTILPSTYEVTETISIDAPNQKVHSYINNLQTWNAWGSWYEADPTIEQTMGEQTSGVGASQSWTGKDGDGRLVFTKVEPNQIAFDLYFGEFPKCTARFDFVPDGDHTQLSWTMNGEMPMPILGGYMVLIFEPAIRADFQKGLVNLKRLVETGVHQG